MQAALPPWLSPCLRIPLLNADSTMPLMLAQGCGYVLSQWQKALLNAKMAFAPVVRLFHSVLAQSHCTGACLMQSSRAVICLQGGKEARPLPIGTPGLQGFQGGWPTA
eukprot:1138500-Pelagomonas_calceolata.AAC.2